MSTVTYVIAVYKPFAGLEAQLDSLLTKHFDILLEEGLVGPQRHVILKTQEGYRLETIAWKTKDAAAQAHQSAKVAAIWKAMAEVTEFKSLADIDGAQIPFAKFEVVPNPPSPRRFADTMMSSGDYEKQTKFYRDFLDLKVLSQAESFTVFSDVNTSQTLCITRGESVKTCAPGIQVENLESSLQTLERCGGKIEKQWEFTNMKGVNAIDPCGTEILLWQLKG